MRIRVPAEDIQPGDVIDGLTVTEVPKVTKTMVTVPVSNVLGRTHKQFYSRGSIVCVKRSPHD